MPPRSSTCSPPRISAAPPSPAPRDFAKTPIQRVTIRSVELREGPRLQVSRFDGRKDISTNHTTAELPAALVDILAAGFANVHITTTTEEIDLRLTKKGDFFIGRTPATVPGGNPVLATPAPHNRPKDVPLPEGRADPLLQALGILDRHARVRPTMRDKFTQINEFLKLLDHVLPAVMPAKHDQELLILDCGCGSSHLTLATAHFLTEIKGIPARVVGIDQNAEVIAKSRAAPKAPGGSPELDSPLYQSPAPHRRIPPSRHRHHH